MKISEIIEKIYKLNITNDEKTIIINRLADLLQVMITNCYEGVSIYQGPIKKNKWLDFVVEGIYNMLMSQSLSKNFSTVIKIQVLEGVNEADKDFLLSKINNKLTEKLKTENKEQVIRSIKSIIIDKKIDNEDINYYLESNDYNQLLERISHLDVFYIYLMYLVNVNTIGNIITNIPNKIQELKVREEEQRKSKSKAIYPSSVVTSKSKSIKVKATGTTGGTPSHTIAKGASSGMPKPKESETERDEESRGGSHESDLAEILKGFQKLYSNIPILKKIIESRKLGKKQKSEFESIIVGLTKFINLSQSKQDELKQNIQSQINRNARDLEQELEKQLELYKHISKAIQNSHNIIKYQNHIMQDLFRLLKKTQELNKYKAHIDLEAIDISTLRAILAASAIKSKESESREIATPQSSEIDISEMINDKKVEKVVKQISKLNKVSKRPQKIIKLDDALDDLAILTAKEIEPGKPIREPIKDILKKFPKSITDLIKNVRKGVSKPIDILIQKLGGSTLRRITGLGHIQDNVSLKAIADKVYRLLSPALPIPKYLSRVIQSLKNLKYYHLAKRSARVVSDKIKSADQAKIYKDIEKKIDKNKEFYSKNYLGRRILFGIASAIGSIYRNSVEKSSLINKILETLFGVKPIKITAALRFKRLNKIKKTKSTEEKIDDTKSVGPLQSSSITTVQQKDDIKGGEKLSERKSEKTTPSQKDKSDKARPNADKSKEQNKESKAYKPKGLTLSSKRIAYSQIAPDLISYAEIKLPKKKEVQEEIQKRESLIDDDFMREYLLNEIEMNEALARMLSEGASDKSSGESGEEGIAGSPASALNNISNVPDQAETVTSQSGSMIARLSNKFSSKLRSFQGKLNKGISKVMKPVRGLGGKFAKAFKVASSRLSGFASTVLSKLLRGVPVIGWLTTIAEIIKTAWNVSVAVKAMSPKVKLGYDRLVKNKEEELYKSINEAYTRSLSTGGYQRIIENIRGEGKARENIGEYALIRDKRSAPASSGAVTKPKDIKLSGAEGTGVANAPKPIKSYEYQTMETGFHSVEQQYKELLESNVEIQKQTIAVINQLNSAIAYTDTKATTNAMRQTAAEEQKSSTKVVSGNKVYGFRSP